MGESPKREHKFHPLQKYNNFCIRHSFPRKWVTTVIIIILLIVVFLIYMATVRPNSATYESRTIDFGLQDIGELATQAGYYTNVAKIERGERTFLGAVLPGTASRQLAIYKGVIKAGLDFDQIEIDRDEVNKTATFRMPAIRILSNDLDPEGEVWDDQNSIFNIISLSEIQASLGEVKARAEEQAIENGILVEAKRNAEKMIRSMFENTVGVGEYEVSFVWTDEQ